ncbi:MAG: hypothetical protein K0R47_3057, partial [Brevibacillus sp.]|nr:hypothetical protein [Brevibacillus sp.]
GFSVILYKELYKNLYTRHERVKEMIH